MFEWLAENLWLAWLAAGVALTVVEILILDLTFLMLAGGAMAAMGSELIGAPVWMQLGVFAAVSIILFFLVRPVALRHLPRDSDDEAFGVEALPGQDAVVVETITANTGQVKIHGEIWSARSHSRHPISVGTSVQIERVDSAILWVNIPLTA